MRTLCEQTETSVRRWLEALHSGATPPTSDQPPVALHLLMGGEEIGPWTLAPYNDQILIGTQDMLLSRALNRGYGASRFQWPIEFALLNNDCAWVFDEPQLMANGLHTSAQLTGLRDSLGAQIPCSTLWMSATLDPEWLKTVDHSQPLVEWKPAHPIVDTATTDGDMLLARRLDASKRLLATSGLEAKEEKLVAKFVLEHHVEGTQTLVIVNTVDRARKVYDALRGAKGKNAPAGELLLVHSRFRPADRQRLNARLMDENQSHNRIVVATQVVEAGVDISAQTLITELAPWPSLVQRMGRCNRTGENAAATVHWIDLPENLAPPYDVAQLDVARDLLRSLEDCQVSPRALESFARERELRHELPLFHTLRRRDILDLFDTTADLSGQDVDVQRFIRSNDPDTDLHVFWREFESASDLTAPDRVELCPVPVGELREFLKDTKKRLWALVWDFLDGEWRRIEDPNRDLRPGNVVCLRVTAGGYSDLGWSKKGDDAVPSVVIESTPRQPESTAADPLSTQPNPHTVAEHTAHVVAALTELLSRLPVPQPWADFLSTAARWHDVGKFHPVFQGAMTTANTALDPTQAWAKSGVQARLVYQRRYFRHELASALAALQAGQPFPVAYLAGCHHGRVRMGIRPGPEETGPATPNLLFALGVYEGDVLPPAQLDGLTVNSTPLDLGPMRLGGPSSWTGSALQLLEQLGPFRLAWYEALIRLADQIASAREVKS
jgi:CRISPR-associated endonuclease/helicase Cas3